MPPKAHIVSDDNDIAQSKPKNQSPASERPTTLTKGKKRKRKGTPLTLAPTPNNETITPKPPKEEKKHGNQAHLPVPPPNISEKPRYAPRNQHPRRSPKPQAHPRPTQPNPNNPLLKRRDALLPVRKALPIWPHADTIRLSLRKTGVLLLTGETGSGKSTQVPQFLLSEPWCTKCIAITQPRRVAAISLARRVAEEMGSLFGSQSPTAKVGYSVRFDTATGPNTRIKFLTEGMLLQEMLRDPELNNYSAVVVDEVHERSVNVDLILGFLRQLVRRNGKSRRKDPLKVVVMSATADVEGLARFFEDEVDRSEWVPEEAKDEEREDSGSEKSWSGISSNDERESREHSKSVSTNGTNHVPGSKESKSSSISTCFVEGRQYPVKTIYLTEPTQDFVESALRTIFQIHYKEPLPGDILVFLTGQDTIEALDKLVNEYAQAMDKEVPKLLPLPLFAALPQHAQQRIFTPAPPRTRKVILATNIAETSVTVSGVRFVVDCGKSKIKQFRNRLGLDSLLVKPISQSAAIQRKGRAGREAPGHCYRLYTEEGYNGLEKRTTPEILRCDLSHAILTMKARGVDDALNFPFLDKPPREVLEKALLQLLHLGALTETGAISDIGLTIAKLPLTPTLGRVIVEAATPKRDCLLDIIDIISCLSVENIFLNLVTEEKKEEAEAARRKLYRREGDHMMLLTTVQRYAEERTDRKVWCERHFVSHRAMQNVMDIRKQLRQQCASLSLLPPSPKPAPTPSDMHTTSILHSLLRGFVSNTARLMPDGSYRTFMGNQTVAIHPSSVLFGKKVEAIVFSEFVFTGKAWGRGVSAVQLDWVGNVVEGLM